MENHIIENIRHFRKELNIKTEYISSQLGISQGEYSKIENGQRNDYYKYLPQLAQIFQIDFLKLVTPRNNVSQTNNHQQGGTALSLQNIYGDMEVYKKALQMAEETIEMQKILIEELRKKK